MKNTKTQTGSIFVFGNIITAILALTSLYGFLQSAEKSAEGIWLLSVFSLFTLMDCPLTKDSQRKAVTAAVIISAIAAVIVIVNVGVWILNIRYLGLVFAVFAAALSFAQLALFTAESRKARN